MEIDYSLFVNFFVALGTILLAIFAFRNIQITRNQLKSFQDQTKVFISQNQPHLRIRSAVFRKNELRLHLRNLGNQPAYDIGFSSICYSVRKVQDITNMQWMFDFKWPHIKKEDVKDYFEIEYIQQITIKDNRNPNNQIILKPEYSFTFLKRDDNGESDLSSVDDVVLFKSEPYFLFDNDFDNKKEVFLKGHPEALENYTPQSLSFDEIWEILRKKNIRYVYLAFKLYCKDSLEHSIYQNDIIECIIDLEEDQTIEEAISKPRKLTNYLMSPPKFVKDIGYQPFWMYEHSKWRAPNIEDEQVE